MLGLSPSARKGNRVESYKTTLPAQSAAGGDIFTEISAVQRTESDLNYTVSEIVVVSPTAVTGVATNNFTLSVRQLRAGSVVATIGSVTFGSGTNLAVETPLVVPVTTAPSLQQDDVLDVLLHQNGTGLAVPVGIVVEVELL